MSLIAKLIWTAGFLILAIGGATDIWKWGWLPYEFLPLPFNIYWTSLVILLPLAALLIWAKERLGVVLGCLIMGSIVFLSSYPQFVEGQIYFGLVLESAFAAFVFFSAIQHWRSNGKSSEIS